MIKARVSLIGLGALFRGSLSGILNSEATDHNQDFLKTLQFACRVNHAG